MGYFANNKTVSFRDLEESGHYSEELLQQIRIGNYEILNRELYSKRKEDRDFMEPILYAVRNQNHTYAVYKYYGENLQKKDINLASIIIESEPHLIKESSLSSNGEFMLKLAQVNPKAISCISEDLKSNGVFIQQICDTQNKELIENVAKECKIPDVIKENSELSENKDFMLEIIKRDPEQIENASENLKDDYEFVKESCETNDKVVDYIADNTEEFGENGLNAAKEVIVDNTTSKAIEEFRIELDKIENSPTEIESEKQEDKDVETKKVSPEIRKRQLNNGIKLLDRIKNGEVKPERAIRLINSLCKDMDEEYKKELMKYIKIDDAVIDKQKEEKEEFREVTRDEVTETTEDVRISEIEGNILEKEIGEGKEPLQVQTGGKVEKTGEEK